MRVAKWSRLFVKFAKSDLLMRDPELDVELGTDDRWYLR